MSANHGSLEMARSFSSGKLSLWAVRRRVHWARERDGLRQHFQRLFYLEFRDQILEGGGSNE